MTVVECPSERAWSTAQNALQMWQHMRAAVLAVMAVWYGGMYALVKFAPKPSVRGV